MKSTAVDAPPGPGGATDADQRAAASLFWSGATAAILKPKDQTGQFNLTVSSGGGCSVRGTGTYTGTLSGANVNGNGVMNVALTAAFNQCTLFDGNVITAPVVTFTGTVAITSDARAATQVRVVATVLTVNGRACEGGIDITVLASSPSAPATGSGTACGVIRTYTLSP